MDVILRPTMPSAKKRKRKSKTTVTNSDPINKKLNTTDTALVTMVKLPKTAGTKVKNDEELIENTEKYPILRNHELVSRFLKVPMSNNQKGEYSEKYPVLRNHELVNKFLNVPMTNNQKGRIRQAVRDSLQGTSNVLVPEIIHNKIQSILRSSENLTDSELRRVRILYNLLKTALKGEQVASEIVKDKTEKVKKKKVEGDSLKPKDGEKKEKKKEQNIPKVKGPKRYVVFLGNLPLDIDKEKIMKHFSEMNEHIVDIRIPKTIESKKSAIAYLELSNEPSYEFALSKHHSMLGSKRINVLYTAPKKGKVTKATAKSKSAKLIALQKSGKLVGSVPLAKKRSQRRLKMKQAQAKLAQQNAT